MCRGREGKVTRAEVDGQNPTRNDREGIIGRRGTIPCCFNVVTQKYRNMLIEI